MLLGTGQVEICGWIIGKSILNKHHISIPTCFSVSYIYYSHFFSLEETKKYRRSFEVIWENNQMLENTLSSFVSASFSKWQRSLKEKEKNNSFRLSVVLLELVNCRSAVKIYVVLFTFKTFYSFSSFLKKKISHSFVHSLSNLGLSTCQTLLKTQFYTRCKKDLSTLDSRELAVIC